MILLTKKQKNVLDYINQYVLENGISPTIDEIRKGLKLKAISTVHEHVKTLLKNGYLTKNKNSSRNIDLKKLTLIKEVDDVTELEISKLQARLEEMLNKFDDKQRALIIEAMDIENKLTMIGEGYKLKDLD